MDGWQVFAQCGDVDIPSANESDFGYTPLMIACLSGTLHAVQALLYMKADPEHQAADGARAVHMVRSVMFANGRVCSGLCCYIRSKKSFCVVLRRFKADTDACCNCFQTQHYSVCSLGSLSWRPIVVAVEWNNGSF